MSVAEKNHQRHLYCNLSDCLSPTPLLHLKILQPSRNFFDWQPSGMRNWDCTLRWWITVAYHFVSIGMTLGKYQIACPIGLSLETTCIITSWNERQLITELFSRLRLVLKLLYNDHVLIGPILRLQHENWHKYWAEHKLIWQAWLLPIPHPLHKEHNGPKKGMSPWHRGGLKCFIWSMMVFERKILTKGGKVGME